jgi:hypothetical protein
VWTTFSADAPRIAAASGSRGSDQGWINHVLGRKEATWTRKDGVYSYRKHLTQMANRLPDDARVVAWHGKTDPWSHRGQQIDWVRQHYPVGLTA